MLDVTFDPKQMLKSAILHHFILFVKTIDERQLCLCWSWIFSLRFKLKARGSQHLFCIHILLKVLFLIFDCYFVLSCNHSKYQLVILEVIFIFWTKVFPGCVSYPTYDPKIQTLFTYLELMKAYFITSDVFQEERQVGIIPSSLPL